MAGGNGRNHGGGTSGGKSAPGEDARGEDARGEGARGEAAGGKATIYDVAKRSGVSASTVSLVLNGTWKRYRIKPETAKRVLEVAERANYRTNARARALRLQRSSLAGMVIPHYRNRFFAGLSEQFEACARARGLCPIVVSTQRDPATEASVARTLISQQVEVLILAGVAAPGEINAACAKAGIRTVNLDLPGEGAFSVVTDNLGGARALTERLMAATGPAARICFIGGRADEFATDDRVEGFGRAIRAGGGTLDDAAIDRCGYGPDAARAALERLAASRAGFPKGLFVNSITALEGFATFLRDRPGVARGSVVACFDWDPFAACLPVPIVMMRQDVEALMEACFEVFDRAQMPRTGMVVIPPRIAYSSIGAEAT